MKVCVYGASSERIDEKYKNAGFDLGKKMGEKGYTLVFGAGAEGMMGAVARGFHAGGGKVHGYIPKFFEEGGYEAIYYDCDELNFTKTMAERKAGMENECEAFIIAPGGIGTFEEFFQVFTLKQLGRHDKAIVLFNSYGYYDDMRVLIEDAIKSNFVNKECANLIKYCDTAEEIMEYLESYNPSDIAWSRLKRIRDDG